MVMACIRRYLSKVALQWLVLAWLHPKLRLDIWANLNIPALRIIVIVQCSCESFSFPFVCAPWVKCFATDYIFFSFCEGVNISYFSQQLFALITMLIYGCLLWWLLLGRYLKGVSFHCISSDYTKTEYGFWAHPAVLSKNPTNGLPLSSAWSI